MRALETSSDTGTGVTTGIEDVSPVVVFGLVEQRLDSGLGERPGTCVEGLFLRPDDGLGVGVRVEVLLELLPWEGVELFDTRDSRVGDLVLLTVLVERGVRLTRAENDALDLVVGVNLKVMAAVVGDIGNDPLEVAVASEVLDAGSGERMTQERLGEEEDEGCRESQPELCVSEPR